MIGRSIRLFLVDGAATGMIIAEIVNWTGKVIVVPRAALGDFLARPEATKAGVYILSGPDPDDVLRSLVYVGESEQVGNRIRNHDKDTSKEFFEKAVICVSKDENVTKAHVRYLEERLVGKIRSAERARIQNGNEPGGSALPEADQSDMLYFLSQLELVLPVLGLDIVRPQIERSKTQKTDKTTQAGESNEGMLKPIFEMNDLDVQAEAQESNNEFVIKAGSIGRAKTNAATAETTILLRKKMIGDGVFIEEGDTLRLTKDTALSSPSRAANVLYGGSVNGRWYWKVKGSHKSYGEWREEQLSQTSEPQPSGSKEPDSTDVYSNPA